METKVRIATVVWWIGVVVLIACALYGLVAIVVVSIEEPQNVGMAILFAAAYLAIGVACYFLACTIRYLMIGVFWAKPKISGPKGSN
ncbi:MAG TPA: hypothetical protein DD666_00675 [Advenella kashmirensis]|uniref:Lipoprotein n=1 Tax=Advenella kashmirensis TaxID=310575 RepID=A0A356LA97_9BURK|nr:hypothetical protein [Advenella kashmirensis]